VSKLKSQLKILGAFRLLAIDDNPEDLKLIATALKQEGVEILTGKTLSRG